MFSGPKSSTLTLEEIIMWLSDLEARLKRVERRWAPTETRSLRRSLASLGRAVAKEAAEKATRREPSA